MKEVALLFGSFNPIHLGHLSVAKAVLTENRAEEVWLVPTPQSPHKNMQQLLPDHHRLAMAKIAVENQPAISVCDIEFSLLPPYYTARTLEVLKETYPQNRFALVMGEDNWQSLSTWHRHKEIMKFPIWVYPRKTSLNTPIEIPKRGGLLNMPKVGISATEIRKLLFSDKKIAQALLPKEVMAYIKTHDLFSAFMG